VLIYRFPSHAFQTDAQAISSVLLAYRYRCVAKFIAFDDPLFFASILRKSPEGTGYRQESDHIPVLTLRLLLPLQGSSILLKSAFALAC
jgi:hypothetical protein